MPWWTPGWGRGWRWCFWATGMPGWLRWQYPPFFTYPPYPPKPEDELELLEELKKALEADLEDIKARIEELKKKLD